MIIIIYIQFQRDYSRGQWPSDRHTASRGQDTGCWELCSRILTGSYLTHKVSLREYRLNFGFKGLRSVGLRAVDSIHCGAALIFIEPALTLRNIETSSKRHREPDRFDLNRWLLRLILPPCPIEMHWRWMPITFSLKERSGPPARRWTNHRAARSWRRTGRERGCPTIGDNYLLSGMERRRLRLPRHRRQLLPLLQE